jgi:hypothetical protein
MQTIYDIVAALVALFVAVFVVVFAGIAAVEVAWKVFGK